MSLLALALVRVLVSANPQECEGELAGSKVLADRPCEQSVPLLLSALKGGESETEQRNDASDLFDVVGQIVCEPERVGCTKGPIEDAWIDDLITLLSSPDEAVRAYSAAALGKIGPRATRAIPALERALADANRAAKLRGFTPEMPPEFMIGFALQRVRGDWPHKTQRGP